MLRLRWRGQSLVLRSLSADDGRSLTGRSDAIFLGMATTDALSSSSAFLALILAPMKDARIRTILMCFAPRKGAAVDVRLILERIHVHCHGHLAMQAARDHRL